MDRIALVARLKPGSEERAAQLVGAGPPFDLGASRFTRHEVYLSAGEVVFVFEGEEVAWVLEEMVNQPSGALADALGAWREVAEGPPRIARPAYAWER